MIGEKLAKFVVVAVVIVWAITTLILPVVIHGYTPPSGVGTVMGIVAGGAVAVIFARRSRDGNGNGQGGKKTRPKEDNGRSLTERALERGRQRKERNSDER